MASNIDEDSDVEMFDAQSAATPKSSHAKHTPWLEKYRPTKLNDIVGNEEAIARLAHFAQQGNLPNIIISGPPGCGKVTVIDP